jgi:hypothetical protein
MSKEQSGKCAHASCQCQAAANDKYCSQYCKDAKNVTELGCGCTHPACSVSAKIQS